MRLGSASSATLVALIGVASVGLVGSLGAGEIARPSAAGAQGATPGAVAMLYTAAGDEVGRATFTDNAGTVTVSVSASGLPPGFHGFHVHSVAQCDPPDFMSAGGHYNPSGMNHAGHAGDMSSLLVNQDGSGQMTLVTDRFSVDELLAGAGTALIVHAGADNFANIPTRYAPAPDAMTLATGDSGSRLACGLIQATGA